MCKFSKTLEFKRKDCAVLNIKRWVVLRPSGNHYVGDVLLHDKTKEVMFESDDYVALTVQEMFDIARFMRIKEEKHIFNKPYLTK